MGRQAAAASGCSRDGAPSSRCSRQGGAADGAGARSAPEEGVAIAVEGHGWAQPCGRVAARQQSGSSTPQPCQEAPEAPQLRAAAEPTALRLPKQQHGARAPLGREDARRRGAAAAQRPRYDATGSAWHGLVAGDEPERRPAAGAGAGCACRDGRLGPAAVDEPERRPAVCGRQVVGEGLSKHGAHPMLPR